ncbi:MAG: MarC family protein, partial [Kiritimatiellia bacterium]
SASPLHFLQLSQNFDYFLKIRARLQVIMLFGQRIARFLGARVLDAIESLMGLLLTCLAVGLVLKGINQTYGL